MQGEKTSGVNAFCVGGVLIFVGSIVLCVVGMVVVVPYAMTRHWIRARCTVVRAYYDFDACTCNEDPALYAGCVYKYPCLQVYVTYVDEEEEEEVVVEEAGVAGSPTGSPAAQNQMTTSNIDLGLHINLDGVNNINKANMTEDRDDNAMFKDPTWTYLGQNKSVDRRVVDSETATQSTGRESVTSRTSKSGYRTEEGSVGVGLTFKEGTRDTNGDFNRVSGKYDSQHESPLAYDAQRQRKGVVARLSSGRYMEHSDPTYSLLYRRWSDAFYNTCSVYECGTEGWNIRQMNLFLTEYGNKHQSFICYHEPIATDTSSSSSTGVVNRGRRAAGTGPGGMGEGAREAREGIDAADRGSLHDLPSIPTTRTQRQDGQDLTDLTDSGTGRTKPGATGGSRGSGGGGPAAVVVERTPGPLVLHAVLWPVVCLGLGAGLWLALCLGCCTLGKKPLHEYEQYKKA